MDNPLEIQVPDLSAGLSPNTGVIPYATVNLFARREDFEEIYVVDIQIFPNTVTIQDLELIPLSELPLQWNKSETYQTTTQNL